MDPPAACSTAGPVYMTPTQAHMPTSCIETYGCPKNVADIEPVRLEARRAA